MDLMTATTVMAAKVCPKAPPGAVGPTNEITGYVLWGVIVLFGLGIDHRHRRDHRRPRVLHASMPRRWASSRSWSCSCARSPTWSLPGMLNGILGKGCI